MENRTPLEQLVEQAKNREAAPAAEQAFASILDRFAAAAFQWAYLILEDEESARDAVQEATMAAYEKLPQLRQAVAFSTWYKRIVVSRCHRLLRQHRFPTAVLELVPELPDLEPDPQEAVEQFELQANVQTAVDALPAREQEVTRLFYLNGYSQKEIARLLELPLTTVKKRLQYARRSLKPILLAMAGNMLPPIEPALAPVPVPVQAGPRE